MRQEAILKTYLKFDELSPEQQEKVLANYQDINIHNSWYDHTSEEFKTKLEKLGFSKIEINFSGFWSQGDGASFTAKHNRGDIYRLGMYSHSNTMRCDDANVLLVARRLADKFYRDLNKEYDYLTSAEAIKDRIKYETNKNRLKTLSLA